MMKKIVLLQGVIETLSYFSMELKEAFEEMDYLVYMLAVDQLKDPLLCQLVKMELNDFLKSDPCVCITFNFIGMSGEACFKIQQNRTIWDEYQVEFFTILVDHPLYYAKQLAEDNSLYHVICIDQYHVDFIKRFYPKKSVTFMTLAGNDFLRSKIQNEIEKDSTIPYENRKHALTFIGNYPNIRPIGEIMRQQSKEYVDFYEGILHIAKTHTKASVEMILEQALKKEIPLETKEQLLEGMQAIIFLDIYIRAYFRKKVIKHIIEREIPIFLVGKDWEKSTFAINEKVRFSNRMYTSKECIEVIKNSKISLNIMPGFKAGAHDRIYTSMLQKSLVLTDKSEYLVATCKDLDTLCFYDIDNLSKLPEKISGLLKEDRTSKEIADRGYLYAKKEYTWQNKSTYLEHLFS